MHCGYKDSNIRVFYKLKYNSNDTQAFKDQENQKL